MMRGFKHPAERDINKSIRGVQIKYVLNSSAINIIVSTDKIFLTPECLFPVSEEDIFIRLRCPWWAVRVQQTNKMPQHSVIDCVQFFFFFFGVLGLNLAGEWGRIFSQSHSWHPVVRWSSGNSSLCIWRAIREGHNMTEGARTGLPCKAQETATVHNADCNPEMTLRVKWQGAFSFCS